MDRIDWADPEVNLDVVWEPLQNLFYQRAAPRDDPVLKLSFNSKWDSLLLGSRYLVVAFREEGAGRRPALRAAVVRFLDYEDLPAGFFERHELSISCQITEIHDHIERLSYTPPAHECDPDPSGSEEEGFYEADRIEEQIADAQKDIEILKIEVTHAHQKGLRFQELAGDGAGPRRTFLIDPAPFGPRPQVQIEVLELRSFSWVENGLTAAGTACEWLPRGGDTTMRRLRSGYAEHVLRSVAAMRIQRAWRKALSRHDCALRRKRAREEPSPQAGGDTPPSKLQKTFCTIS